MYEALLYTMLLWVPLFLCGAIMVVEFEEDMNWPPKF